jgi:hypothetical protein
MSNLLESSQTQATTAPDYYTNHLSNLATKGMEAATGAKYVGADPLQEQAFQNVAGAASAYKPTLDAAGNTLTSAVSATSPLDAATGYLKQATSDPSLAAASYMTPYIQSVVNQLGEAGQRNIRQNLSPLAAAGAVGGGQFGSKRGAEVLGQTLSNANREILGSQYNALNTGYSDALKAAIQQNQIAGTAGTTAANAASSGQQNLTQAGKAQTDLAAQNQSLGLADINALATLGGQQQTIEQNRQLFPLTNLSTLSSMLRGYNVPTTTKTTAQASPLSVLGGAITGTAGLFTPAYDKNGNVVGGGKTPFDYLTSGLKGAYNQITGQTDTVAPSNNSTTVADQIDNGDGTITTIYADGHQVTSAGGSSSSTGLNQPTTDNPQAAEDYPVEP